MCNDCASGARLGPKFKGLTRTRWLSKGTKLLMGWQVFSLSCQRMSVRYHLCIDMCILHIYICICIHLYILTSFRHIVMKPGRGSRCFSAMELKPPSHAHPRRALLPKSEGIGVSKKAPGTSAHDLTRGFGRSAFKCTCTSLVSV